MSTPIPPDADTIRRLVAEVIARLGTVAPPAQASPPPASTYGQPIASAGATIPDKVVTLGVLERLPAGTNRVVVATSAVITPSARERARDAGIEIVRATTAPGGTAPATRPFVVAHAECAGDAASRCAAIVRGVPGAWQLPATGLADVMAALAIHASRDGARAVLLCGRPATAVVLANRSAGLRAVTARDAASLLAGAAECSANLLVIDPRAFSSVGIDRTCSEFSRRDLGPAPAELAAPPAACACKGHAH